jgi:6-phosphogluconolactonase (cycloisomerase 2 family)
MLAACGSSAPTLRYITISPQTSLIAVTTTQQFTALAYYSDGTIKDGTGLVSWSSSNSAIATINASGVATGVAPGTVTITGTAAGTSGATATLNVNQLTAIAVTPTTATVPSGQTQQYAASGMFTNPDGSTGTSDVTSLATWASDNTAVATIDNTGLAKAVAATGTANITAALYGVTSNKAVLTAAPPVATSLQVNPATPSVQVGGSVNFAALEVLSDGTTQAPTGTVTWSSNTMTTATILNSGAATALATGTAKITAMEGTTLTGNATLTVTAGVTHFAYVANVGSPANPGLGYAQVNATSTTAPLSGYTMAPALGNSAAPFAVAVHPAGSLLFAIDVAGSGKSYLHVLEINPTTGAPKETAASVAMPALAGGGGQGHIAVEPYGRFVYVSDDGSGNSSTGTIYGFTIDQTNHGALTLIGVTTANINGPQDLVIDPTGTYLYVTNSGANTVSAYSINQTTGALTPLVTPTAATGTTPYFETLDPSGTHLFVGNSGGNTVSVFTLGTGGALGTASTFAVTGAAFIVNVAVAPSGSFIYFLDEGTTSTGTVYAYTLSGATIGTTAIGSVATGVGPTAMNIDATGALLTVNNTSDNTISLYSIGSNGGLTALTPPTLTVGGNPWWTAFYNAAK